MSADYSTFLPNPELLESMIQMGIDTETAKIALYKTGNQSCDAAIAFVFDNPLSEQEHHDAPETDVPPELETKSSASLPSKQRARHPMRENDVDATKGYKMVFVVNTKLDMSMGKTASQVAHAALAVYRALNEDDTANVEALEDWEHDGEKCIILRGQHERHLQDLQSTACGAGILSYIIRDAGITEVASGSATVLALFGTEQQIDSITGNLSLL